jgi:O-antigen/teichoic acid export membrane protein
MERIDKNFLWLTAANIVGSLFSVLLAIYLARVLEAEYFGYLSYATALVFYLFNFVDLGLTTYGIREVAKDRLAVSRYVSNIVSFKLVMAGTLFIIFSILFFFTAQPPILMLVMLETLLMLFASALATEWAFQGMEKMHMVFISIGTTTFLQLVLSLFFVKGPADIARVPLITLFGSLPIVIIFLKRFDFRLRISRIDFRQIRLYLSSSMAIWAISVFAQAYNGLDIVILGFFRPPAEIGSFTVARRIAGAGVVLMMLLAGAVLPHLSCTFLKDMAGFRHATAKFLRISMLLVVLVFVPLAVFSDQIISMTVGAQYLSASIPLKIMTCALVLVMFNLPFSTGLIAACFEKDVLKQAFASAVLSVILNFALMPKYGMIGASVSYFMAELLALIWILVLYRKRVLISR